MLSQPFATQCACCRHLGCWAIPPWRVLQGVFDPDSLGHNWSGVALREGLRARGACTGAGWRAFLLYRGLSPSSGTTGRQRRRGIPLARWYWMVVLAGLCLIGFGVQQIYAAISAMDRNLDVEECAARLESGRSVSCGSAWLQALLSSRCSVWHSLSPVVRDPSELGSSLRILAGNRDLWAVGL